MINKKYAHKSITSRGVFKTHSNIYDGAFLTIFATKRRRRYSIGFEIPLCLH